ncbi:MAG: GH3 auxin-responsive promoter family protein [Gemmatales bacterium]|nr:GH3 auxin-responsive promoter family protein [Gemmatales bacterium]MDW8221601.1 GH3 auxin-responsive promoter family protein [Gemmatales bacterium]
MFFWLLRKVLAFFAKRQARRWAGAFDQATHQPREVQEALLRRILTQHAQTEFGREHRFSEIRTLADYRRHLPIRCYEDFEPYIEQVKQGRLEALLGDERVLMFALTSGTTRSRKFIPVTQQYLADYRRGWTLWGLHVYEQHRDALMRPILQLVSDWDEFRTESGIPCGSVSGLTAHMQKRLIRWVYCMPSCTAKIRDIQAKYYVALRLSLARNLGMIISANPSTLVNLARTLEQYQHELIRDLYDGTLYSGVEVPRAVREALRPKLRRQRRRAWELDRLAERNSTLRPKDVWPRLALLGNWTGGSVGAYLRLYPRYFGDTPVRDLGLLASEGRFSIPLEDHTPSGVLDITSHFFEFIPVDEMDSSQPTVLAAHEVEEGRDYFLILTTAYGLYRYNIYDVVRVTGFYHRTPMIAFLNKGSHFANITGEKLSAFQVSEAMRQALSDLDLALTNYTLAPCWDEDRPYYGLFIEQSEPISEAQLLQLAEALDRRLRLANSEYDEKRKSRLGEIRVVLVAAQGLHDWDRQRLRRSGGTPEQYKHPVLWPDFSFREQVPIVAELHPTVSVH